MTTTSTETTDATERIHADHAMIKRLGNWTRTGHIQVRARRGLAVLDLRSPDLPDDIDLHLELQRATVKLLVPDDAVVDHWALGWTARGKVKDAQGRTAEDSALADARRIRLTGVAADSEVRVHRGGIAVLSAMCSRAYLRDLRLAHRTGDHPTVDDPARSHGH